MKRIYACIAIVAVLLGVAFYSSWKVQSFAEVISADLDAAAEAIRNADHPAARQALADGAARCDQMRTSMNHLLRTADFTELEAALRAADGHLEMNAPEEAFGAAVWSRRKASVSWDAGGLGKRSIAPLARWQVSRLWYGFRPLAETAPQTLHAG